MKALLFALITTAFLPVFSQAADEELVELLCRNSEAQEVTYVLTKSDYDFVSYGNNALENEFERITGKKRSDDLSLLDKKDTNLATAVYSCVVQK